MDTVSEIAHIGPALVASNLTPLPPGRDIRRQHPGGEGLEIGIEQGQFRRGGIFCLFPARLYK
uniref:Uncharacterized protein n=1 Tax=Candidatus Kentrum sp. TUN TaxID=2126343 RepID=A0A450ZYZ2_9GAMM|nr:MAG: hypothetical protein BECKTUN1418D_GA0071000_10942 [Candidatus Kentron sp. TUN]